jgi:hypothetical protein
VARKYDLVLSIQGTIFAAVLASWPYNAGRPLETLIAIASSPQMLRPTPRDANPGFRGVTSSAFPFSKKFS